MKTKPVVEMVDALGSRLAGLRKLNGLSLEEVALRSGLTKSYLSKVERAVSQPSIATVLKLARALGVTSGQLLGEEPHEDGIVVVRKEDRVPFSRAEGRSGYAYEAIAAHRDHKAMTPFIMRPPLRSGGKPDLVDHPGEELIHVIHGEMEVAFADRTVHLRAGDSLYFDASIPHRSRSLGKVPAEALVVVSATSADSKRGRR
jgi:transcriptional regulator with XRE-family HTH domain